MIRTFKNAGLLTAAILGCTACYGGTVFTTPPGLAPGTKYQLVFVTVDGFFATSSAISDYNVDVTAEAALNATLAAFDTANGVTWTVIGSTTSVNADANAPSTGLVYTLDGTEVASSGLYGGSLLSPIDIDQNGNTDSTSVWTGSTTAGTVAGGINDLGQTFPEIGASGAATGAWIASENGIESDNDLALYALSSVITVPAASAVPEPGTIALTAGAFLLLGAMRRKRMV
ncbi:MAG: PEP-CTERM sorting domain-containing protein [Bryobacteraceae bacterium]